MDAIKKPQLGHVYMRKDGNVVLYMGVGADLYQYWYRIGAICYADSFKGICIYNKQAQMKYINLLIIDVLGKPVELNNLVSLKTLSTLYLDLGVYFNADTLKAWVLQSTLSGTNLNNLKLLYLSDAEPVKNIALKDLKVGAFYYVPVNDNPDIFIYLGRDKLTGAYCWYHCIDINQLVGVKTISELMAIPNGQTVRTSTIKKLSSLYDLSEGRGLRLNSVVDKIVREHIVLAD